MLFLIVFLVKYMFFNWSYSNVRLYISSSVYITLLDYIIGPLAYILLP